ncbi:carboxylesterase family protein [Microbacterium schleiferi]
MVSPAYPEDVSTETAEATISTGPLRGGASDGIRRFLGIPYAAPPFGPRRFQLPSAPDSWTGVRDATQFGPAAPQTPYRGRTGQLLPSLNSDGTDEDILTVNVWTPASATEPASGPLPVVLWIHGGAFERGGSSLDGYDGTSFARSGVVFVSANYRLGSEGFSVLEDAPRNLGLEDVAAALRWTHAEIAAFGGDPSRITVMGESAGGALVGALLSRPDTGPLVSGAIIESGPLDAADPKRAGRVTRALAKRLGIPATREAFAALSPAELLAARTAQAAGSSPLRGAPGFLLARDPESLPESPRAALPTATAPILIGTNTDEYRLWFTPDALARISPWQATLGHLALKIPRAAVRAYRTQSPHAGAGDRLGQALTDSMLRAPMTQVADRRTAPTFVYEFAWQSPVDGLGAGHALELGFVFDGLDKPDSIRMAGDAPPQRLAHEMHDAWVRMIRDGDPGWEPFAPGRRVRVFDVESRTLPLPRADAVDAFSSAS